MTAIPPAEAESTARVYRQAILTTLQQTPQPQSVARISACLPKASKLSRQELTALLQELVEEGILYRYGSVRAPRFWTRGVVEFAHMTIQDLLGKRSRTRSELAKALDGPLSQVSRDKRQKFVADLLKAGQIRELPPLLGARVRRLSVAPPAPREYVEHALAEICRRMAAAGIDATAVLESTRALADERLGAVHAPPAHPSGHAPDLSRNAIPEEQIGARILATLPTVEPAVTQGALVAIRDVRRSAALAHLEKQTFDRAVLALSEQERIALHQHDYPGSLSAAERDELVSDGAGTFFIGITLRR